MLLPETRPKRCPIRRYTCLYRSKEMLAGPMERTIEVAGKGGLLDELFFVKRSFSIASGWILGCP